jgi:hypothetical protein
MYQPSHLDGCSVVVLRKGGLGHILVKSGFLEFDGKELSLVTVDGRFPFSKEEVESLKLAVPGNRIPECQGFRFFRIERP